jgi:hypothetical protein
MARFSDKLFSKLAARPPIKVAAPYDMSLGELSYLYMEGYTTITWQASYDPCNLCATLNGQVFDLQDFISGLNHDAPFFENAHVGCRCTGLVEAGTGEDEFGFDVIPQMDSVIVQPY